MSSPAADAGAAAARDLSSACAALGLAIPAETQARLLAFLGLLERWNTVYNLTGVREVGSMMTLHLADCLAVLEPLRHQLGNLGGKRLLDVGSGGGLPGAVLAIVEPELEVLCVDAVGKKAAFVRQVSAALAVPNLDARHARVERLDEPAFDVIAARAFSTLPALIDMTRGLIKPAGIWMAMKGRLPEREISGVPADAEVFHVEPLQVPRLDAARCLVWIRPLRPPDAAQAR
jgi:16S rRNA (guanine527-N7)-methyltransferase